MTEAAVRTEELTKTYWPGRGRSKEVRAVRGIDLEVRRGELFGLIGANGAGKSTMIGMLNTLITPTSGRAWVMGADVAREPMRIKRRCAVVGQHSSMDRELSVAENLEFSGRYTGLRPREARARAAELLERFDLTGRKDALAMHVSGGQLRRMVIARALMRTPELLFLDEPTAGIDPQTRITLWQHLDRLRESGLTMLATTHYLEEAEAICDRVAIIDGGKLIACDTVDALKAAGNTAVTVTFDGPPPVLPDRLLGRPGTVSSQVDGGRLRVITSRPDGLVGELTAAAAQANVSVVDVSTIQSSLQSVYLALTGRVYNAGRRVEI
jgi:ABC-type multidrug transport system ATPase subunit